MRFPRLNKKVLRWVAVAVVVLIEVTAVFLLVVPTLGSSSSITLPPFSSTTQTRRSTASTSTTQVSPPPELTVSGAVIENDTLSMFVKNTGTVPTSTLNIAAVCGPGFLVCFNYASLGGRNANNIFVLPPGGHYRVNITNVCVVPEASCSNYYPVANGSYYLLVKFIAPSGKFVYAGVTAHGNNTYPLTSAVQGIVYTFPVFSRNLSGSLTAYIATNSSEDHARFQGNLYRQFGKGTFNQKLLTNSTGCGGTYPIDCSSGNITMTLNFSTVTTGIATQYYPGPYLFVVRDLTARRLTYFALWVDFKRVP